MTPARPGVGRCAERVVVLQSRQPVTTDVTSVFPNADVLVLTDASPEAALRDDVPSCAVCVESLPRGQWQERLRDLAGRNPLQVITNDEYCLEVGEQLRSSLGLPSRPADQVLGYLDKVVTKTRLRAAGVRVPRFVVCEPVVRDPEGTVRRVLDEVGLPAVAKPRREANSRGVSVLRTADELRTWVRAHEGRPGWHIEEWIVGAGGHANALVRDGELVPVQAGAYLGPLLGFDGGNSLGGRTVAPDGLEARAAHCLNERVVPALGADGCFVVHTEFIRTEDGEDVVIEVAGRAPGALASETARLSAGLNLEEAHLRLQAGSPVAAPRATGVYAGWLWIPVLSGQVAQPTPTLRCEHRVHLFPAGRTGTADPAALGASLLVWGDDEHAVVDDLGAAAAYTWFAA